MNNQSKSIALVTGANKGIGFEVARCLGKAGLSVLVGARNPDLGHAATAVLKAEAVDARYIELDVLRSIGRDSAWLRCTPLNLNLPAGHLYSVQRSSVIA